MGRFVARRVVQAIPTFFGITLLSYMVLRLAPGDPEACGRNFLGDYIAVASTNAKAQTLWTGNGSRGMDVFSARATFAP